MIVLRFTRDNDGGVLVEATIMITIMFVFVLGSIDFLFAFYQWNAATKAVEVGVRIAAVSDPVAKGLNGLSAGVVGASLRPGSAMPSFTVTCDGGTAICNCQGACKGVGGYNATAMQTIVFGRGSTACGDATSFYTAGVCDVFNRITPANVRIVHTQPAAPAGLGFSWASRRPRAYDQDLAAEYAVPILLSWKSIGLPRYADSECNDNDDGRGSLLLLSDNEERLLRLSLSNGAIGRSTRSFWSSAK